MRVFVPVVVANLAGFASMLLASHAGYDEMHMTICYLLGVAVGLGFYNAVRLPSAGEEGR